MAKMQLEQPEFVAPAPANAKETREWNRLALRMDAFHARFRQSFNEIWALTDDYSTTGKMTLRSYLQMVEEFVHHLEMHHGIEEQHIFPVLAKRMDIFKKGVGEHLEQHKHIHAGLERLELFLNKTKSNHSAYTGDELRSILASFGPVLFLHLDEEVKTLQGENMRRYYTLEELRRLPM